MSALNSCSRAFIVALFACCGALPSFAQIEIEEAFPNLRFTRPGDFANDGLGYLYVAEQGGRIYRFPNASTTSDTTAYLDIREPTLYELEGGGYELEAGLLGLVFHPNFAENGYFYTYYITTDPLRSVISRWQQSGDDPGRADPSSELVILEVEQPTTRHNAGDMAFGSDGYLYIALGDGSQGSDAFENAQNLETLLGSILRIDVDNPANGKNYGIPDDNPFAGNMNGYREEIYAYGLRNPWRFSIDPLTQDIWVGDVGEQTWEEVSYIVKGGNYGWPIMEGPMCFKPPENCTEEGLYPPVWAYDRALGHTIIGGFVYRGSRVPELQGRYLFAEWDKNFSNLWALTYDGDPYENPDAVSVESVLDPVRFISTFGVDENQELYMLFTFEGRIMRFKSTSSTDVEKPEPPVYRMELSGPNPFSNQTRLQVSLEQDDIPSIAVYDAMGRRVRTLFEGFLNGGRTLELTFDAGSLPNGIYFIRLESQERFDVESAVLVR